ncbi:DUF4179 domain-containing protein [Paenibacillus sp. 2TAB23]|uniref:DUF4179 domain-containing protein n=1 Tax=Paenibacillus sp. 2TAB23 TaxID=3233004 RepID=UPI003F9D7742
MKDIYAYLNEIDIDENEFAEMEVSELERAKMKQTLRGMIKKKTKKARCWQVNTAVAVILIGCSLTTLALTSPAYASRIPVIGDIFKFLDGGRTGSLFDEYKSYSSVINMAEENKGITITINDAVFDGETVSIAYSLESDQDLGDSPYLFGILDIKGSSGSGGSNQISKVDANHYVGLITATGYNRKEKDSVKLKWNIESITNHESEAVIKGSWSFAFGLTATDNHTQWIDRRAEQDGVIAHIGKIAFTPMSFIVYYDQAVTENVRSKWDGADVDIEVRDDLGNRYAGKGNGGYGDAEGLNMSWSKTFEELDQYATKLIITPKIRLYAFTSENHGPADSVNDKSKSGKGEEQFVLEDIIIDLK